MEILDDERFDFYIHIDKKSADDGHWLANVCKKSKSVFSQKRIFGFYWGTSQSDPNRDDPFEICC